MAQFMVVSDEPLRDYQEFLAQAMRDLSGYKVGGIALVALLEEPDEDGAAALTAYFHLGLWGKEEAAANIQADITDGIVRANMRRYLQELEEEDEEDEPHGEV